MSKISNDNLARAIYLAVKDKTPTERSSLLRNTVKFLAKKKLLAQAPKILARLGQIINEDQGVVAAKVWSVEKLSARTKGKLVDFLARRFGGKTAVLEENLDAGLLGGYKIEVRDEVLDLCLKNRIGQLQTHLTRS